MVVAQCAAEELGVPYNRVRVLLSDTDKTPDGGPTTASRQTYVPATRPTGRQPAPRGDGPHRRRAI